MSRAPSHVPVRPGDAPHYRIAVLLPVEPEYSNRLLEGAIDYALEHPEVELVEMPFVRQGRSPLPEGPLDFHGALLWLNASDTWVERLLAEETVIFNTSGEWWQKGLPSVAFNGPKTEKLALQHLAGLQRGQVAYIGATTSESVELKRRQDTFLAEARKIGMDAAAFEIDPAGAIENRITSLPDKAARRLRRFLKGLPKPAALWCEDDYIARLVCDHAVEEGLRVPGDLAVLGLGDYSVARLGRPPISTIPQPGRLIGRRVVERIHQVLSGVRARARRETLPPPPVMVRESTGGGVPADERFARIHQWIHDHACEGLTVNDLVGMLPMSHFTFSKLFARLYGRTPGEEIRRVKTERAKHYLRTTTLSIERISGLCGFAQQGKFSKFFKRQTGRTPSEYRRGAANPQPGEEASGPPRDS